MGYPLSHSCMGCNLSLFVLALNRCSVNASILTNFLGRHFASTSINWICFTVVYSHFRCHIANILRTLKKRCVPYFYLFFFVQMETNWRPRKLESLLMSVEPLALPFSNVIELVLVCGLRGRTFLVSRMSL